MEKTFWLMSGLIIKKRYAGDKYDVQLIQGKTNQHGLGNQETDMPRL